MRLVLEVPNGGSQGVQLLRNGVNAWDEAIRLWREEIDPEQTRSPRYDRIVDQAGLEYTWGWFLVDNSRPWAPDVPPEVGIRVEADPERRARGSLARRKEFVEEAERLAVAGEERVIENMNASRAERGRAQSRKRAFERIADSATKRSRLDATLVRRRPGGPVWVEIPTTGGTGRGAGVAE
jgi:hypothetical protein